MLAATSTREDQSLELFLLALKSIREDGKEADRLREYFETVVRQALTILAAPDQISEKTLPEAIRLAVELRAANNIDETIAKIETDGKIDPDRVEEILSEVEHQFAS